MTSKGEDDEGINKSDRIKIKIYHNNNISSFKEINKNKMLNGIQKKIIF